MSVYTPLHIKAPETGLVQSRQNFLLPEDAYPILENCYIFREQIRRKQGVQLLGRLQRSLTSAYFGDISVIGAGTFTFNLITNLITATNLTSIETNAQIVPGNINAISIVIGGQTLTDSTGTGTLTVAGAGVITAAKLWYSTGDLILTFSGALGPTAARFSGFYYPGLPVMGLRTEEAQNSAFDNTIAFDQVYSYTFNGATWEEFEPGTTWTGSNSDFFWSTNYWIGAGNFKIFWVTNNVDPIRFTNGVPATGWFDFSPVINSAGGTLTNALCLLPFRGRLVAFNVTQAGSEGGVYTNRIRWAAIGTPFTQAYGAVVTSFNVNAWRDDIRGQGGFLDIPISEDIVSVGFVRDNCVIYCERSTWQLRYTGRTIAPFQIERVNSELGVESTFSSVQFDTSLVGIGDKGVVECDSFKSERIDIKIPDLVFSLDNSNNGKRRVHGIRDFISKLAYWTYPSEDGPGNFPDKRLVYNYENDSWAIFSDSFTCFGTFQLISNRTWLNTNKPWIECNFTWQDEPLGDPVIVAGNQQGYVLIVPNQLNGITTNDVSLSISNIVANDPNPTVVTSVNHNLVTGAVIKITGIISGTPFDNLNDKIFGIIVINDNSFELMKYNSVDQQFSTPQVDMPGDPYLGSGQISVRDNFRVVSKKFNFLDDGQAIQLGYLDILMDATGQGEISINVYVDYSNNEASNILPENEIDEGPLAGVSDVFFNSVIPTSKSPYSNLEADKFWQRVVCPTRGNFITIEYTLNNEQMSSVPQECNVQIDSQVLHIRRAGRLGQPF